MSDIIRYLTDQISKECRVIEEDLAAGHAKDMGEYKFACGRYRGLLTVKGMLMELAERLEHDDD